MRNQHPNISGDVRRFLLVNTTDYNEDGTYCVNDISLPNFEDYGLDKEDEEIASTLTIGQTQVVDKGCLLIRVA